MNRELSELAESALSLARKAGADGCRAAVTRERSVEVSTRERKVENIKEASKRSLTIEVFVDGRYASQTTSDLRREALGPFAADTVAAARLLAPDPFRTLTDPRYCAGASAEDLGVFDPDQSAVRPEYRRAYARAVEDACLAAGGDKVVSVTADVSDGANEWVLLDSNGFQGGHRSTYFSAGASMTAQDEGDRRPNGYHYVTVIRRGDLPEAAAIGTQAAAETLDLLGAKKIKTETLPVVVRNQNVPRLLSGLVAAMSGFNVQQKRSFLADKVGVPVASPRLTLVDDPLLKGGLGSQPFDGDGLAARRRTPIEVGVLREFYLDWYYSRKLGMEPTTGGPTNLLPAPGTRSLEEILKGLGRCILVTGFIGGNSNSTTGDFSAGILGKLCENGAPVQSVAEMNIAGNHLAFWKKLAEAGNDPWPYSAWRTPSLVFEDVVVSGI